MKSRSIIRLFGVGCCFLMLCESSVIARKGGESPLLQVRFNQPASMIGIEPCDAEKTNQSILVKGTVSDSLNHVWQYRALPIGNGNIGAAVFGSIPTERIFLNEKSLWSGGPNTRKGAAYYWDMNKQSAWALKPIRDAFARGDRKTANDLTSNNMNGYFFYDQEKEEPFRFGYFTSMGELLISTGLETEQTNHYSHWLSLDSAISTVRFIDKVSGACFERMAFCSYPDNLMALQFKANKKGLQNLKLTYLNNPEATGQCEPLGTDGLVYTAALNNNGMKFCIRIRAIVKGGQVSNTGGILSVKAADEVMFLLTADTDYKINFNPDYNDPKAYVGVDPLKTTANWMVKGSAMNFQTLLRRHLKDYQPLFNRVKLRLNPAEMNDLSMSTPERLAKYRVTGHDSYLEGLYFQYGRYLLISSSRPGNLPANLQGIWSDNVDAPWHADFHNNINIEMNYWLSLQDNMAECMEPLIDYIKTQVKPGMRTAQSYYGARGWTTSTASNPFGKTAPFEHKEMIYGLAPACGPWLATHIWEYYDFTRNKDWLAKEGFPILKGAANFSCDYLWHKPDGIYTAAPSASPEHGEVDDGATFVHAVIREVLIDAIQAARVLNTGGADTAQWKEVLEHIAPYKIGRYGQLMEWSRDIDDPEDHHRHVNHLFGLHPGHTISPLTTPELAKAACVALVHRGDGATGWSMGWKLNQWARLHDGNHSYILYGNLLKNGTSDNLWDLHPPFQIDGNFGGTAGVTEMLMQSQMGCIHLLPALPDAWKDGSIEGLRARGNFTVSVSWKAGKLDEAVITSGSGETCSVRYGETTKTFHTEKGKKYILKLASFQK